MHTGDDFYGRVLTDSAPAEDWDRIRKEERFRRHGALEVGSRVTLGPVGKDNWNPEQNRYVGMKTQVIELSADPDSAGCFGVRVAADGGVFFWRVRDLEGEGLRSGKFLDCERVEDSHIPLCVIPLSHEASLYEAPALDAAVRGTVPLFEIVDGSRTWSVPRHLYVHERRDDFLHVMESDFGSRTTLGWIPAADTVTWAYPPRLYHRSFPVPHANPSSDMPISPIGGGDPVFTENMDSQRVPDPNADGMCEGLLLQRRAVRGLQVVQCAMTPAEGGRRQVVWLPYPRHQQALIPYVLMTEYDLYQLSAEFAYLYAACKKGYVDEIRRALEEAWDQEAKAMTGTKEKAQKYARFYREIQQIYPALTPLLELPPGETSEQEFDLIGEQAAASQSRVQRIIDEMNRDQRRWAWIKITDL